jgi:hypothetical protein
VRPPGPQIRPLARPQYPRASCVEIRWVWASRLRRDTGERQRAVAQARELRSGVARCVAFCKSVARAGCVAISVASAASPCVGSRRIARWSDLLGATGAVASTLRHDLRSSRCVAIGSAICEPACACLCAASQKQKEPRSKVARGFSFASTRTLVPPQRRRPTLVARPAAHRRGPAYQEPLLVVWECETRNQACATLDARRDARAPCHAPTAPVAFAISPPFRPLAHILHRL